MIPSLVFENALSSTRVIAIRSIASGKSDFSILGFPGIYEESKSIGNAPTALLRLIDLIEEGQAQPALVVGLPVGFVNAAESKAALMQKDYPYISNIGRKGGSNLAASVVNALIILAGN